nr:HutD family protein [uncultured Fusobacterium sp.]
MKRVIKKDDWKVSVWAGGTTNEIFIYPENSSYADRIFKARLSVATTINEEKSLFTKLSGVDRYISKLEGEMKLEHTNHYDVEMEDYQIDRFRGDWETYSYGKFRDFNLMLKGIRGDLYFRQIRSKCRLHLEKDSTIVFLFVVEGSITVNGVELEAEDFYITDDNILDVFGNNPKIYYGFIKEWD